jgi:hypothetical protein
MLSEWASRVFEECAVDFFFPPSPDFHRLFPHLRKTNGKVEFGPSREPHFVRVLELVSSSDSQYIYSYSNQT